MRCHAVGKQGRPTERGVAVHYTLHTVAYYAESGIHMYINGSVLVSMCMFACNYMHTSHVLKYQ